MNPLTTSKVLNEKIKLSQTVTGKPLNIGKGFKALSFKHDQFGCLMDPLIMMDHYTMSSPTFGAHPHAGMSAVSILFEDSLGHFNNRDSIGNNIDLQPGDVYWLKAGKGAVHDEKPTEGSLIHGLQIFVNLPKSLKHDTPDSLHVPSQEIPVITGDNYRVRVVLGESNGVISAKSPALPFTALDTYFKNNGTYTHKVISNQALLIYAVDGSIDIKLDEKEIYLPEQQSIAIHVGPAIQHLRLSSTKKSHAVVLQGSPVKEPFIQKGAFVMSSSDELDQATAAYENGLLGSISDKHIG